jgi:hypothetical protein
MYYICVENDRVTGVLNYEPNVPSSVTVVVISDEDHAKLDQRTHYFDIPTSSIQPYPQSELDKLAARNASLEHQKFLNNTDWKVMRHIREKALGIPTSLSNAEYLDLELERERRAAAITH